MQAINAIYDGAVFIPIQPIPVKEDYEVVITFIKPVKKAPPQSMQQVKRPLGEIIGLLKGKVWMADDFNAPLEEFKEYME